MMETTTKTADLIATLRATTAVAKLGAAEGVALPANIRQAAGWEEGDSLYVEALDAGADGVHVLLRKIDPDQAKERERDANAGSGRVYRFYSTEEFLAALKQWSKEADV
jgi:bifunctional DNA-binding transcriptional regulator/antitoxin component of YhaV-PrlF toxin-antitoxin module